MKLLISDLFLNPESKAEEAREVHEVIDTSLVLEAPLTVGMEKLAAEQKSDISLAECAKAAVNVKDRAEVKVVIFGRMVC